MHFLSLTHFSFPDYLIQKNISQTPRICVTIRNKLEDHPLLAVRDCSFSIFAAVFQLTTAPCHCATWYCHNDEDSYRGLLGYDTVSLHGIVTLKTTSPNTVTAVKQEMH